LSSPADNNYNSNGNAGVPIIVAPDALKLVKNGVVFIQRAEFSTQVIVDRIRFDRM